MRIHCLCLVRDEIDILRHTLDAALSWADAIYALDNGSSDGTWELLQQYAAMYSRIVLVGREHGPYRTAMWGEMASRFRRKAGAADWWCRLDADELYVDDPREFLSSVDPRDPLVFATSIQYYFTDVDLARYERDPSPYLDQWTPERLRYYLANWSEPRFVRHVSRAKWPDEWPPGTWEMHAAPRRIRLRHFQYRSPPQIERRIHTRTTRTQEGRFMHEKTDRWVPAGLREEDLVFPGGPEPWRTRVVRAAALDHDDGGGEYRVNEDLLPPLWKGYARPRPSPLRRLVQRVFR
jgi:glycosyltransferase involved in cell wall biosynthesis